MTTFAALSLEYELLLWELAGHSLDYLVSKISFFKVYLLLKHLSVVTRIKKLDSLHNVSIFNLKRVKIQHFEAHPPSQTTGMEITLVVHHHCRPSE